MARSKLPVHSLKEDFLSLSAGTALKCLWHHSDNGTDEVSGLKVQ